MAREQSLKIPLQIRTKHASAIKVARGSMLTVRLKINHLSVDPAEEIIYWDGNIGNAQFIVYVPESIQGNSRPAVATVYLDGMRIAVVKFVVRFDSQRGQKREIETSEIRYRSAFASYASAYRDEVLGLIQSMHKAAPDLKIFVDVMGLRSGQRWKERLEQEITKRDILYLFWSKAASESNWVDWEWRLGLEKRGISFIDPLPMVHPSDVPPPKELADELHFNDWELRYIQSMKNKGVLERD